MRFCVDGRAFHLNFLMAFTEFFYHCGRVTQENIMTKITGQCLCGDVTYQAEGDVLFQGHCHCVDCRQASGSPFATLVFMLKDDVKVSGETKSFSHTVDSGNTLIKQFCPNCGSQMFSGNPKNRGVGIKAGTINEQAEVKPQFNVYAGSKMDCITLDDSIPAFDKMPPV